MREILFKGKKKQGEWVYGDLIQIHEEAPYWYILPEGISAEMYEDEPYHFRQNDVMCSVALAKVIPETIGQFIGLTDKNKKKIFEGDIVDATISINDCSRDRVRYETGRYEVKYHTKHCYFYLAKEGNNLLFDGNWYYYLKDIEVIGNIHDNPELLGE